MKCWSFLELLGTFFCVCFLSAAQADTAQGKVLRLDDQESSLIASSYVEYLEDPSRTLILEQVQQAEYSEKFIKNNKELVNLGRSRSAWWIRFQITQASQKEWFLLFDSLLGDAFELYLLPVQELASEKNSLANTIKAIPVENFYRRAWRLELPLNTPIQIYARATNGDAFLNLTPELLSSDRLLAKSNSAYRLNTFIYAGMLVLGLYHLIMFFILRDRSYIFVSTNMIFMMLTIHRTNPVFPALDFLSNTGFYFFTMPILIALASGFAYSRALLDSAYYTPTLDRIVKFFIYISLLLIIVVGAIPSGTIIPLCIAIFYFVFTLFIAIRIAIKGNKIAKYFAYAFAVPVVVDLVNIINLIVNISFWRAHQEVWVAASTLFFMLMLSVIQATRVRLMREDMQRAAALVETKDEFLAVMNHELRTPLNAISGLGVLLNLSRPLNDQQQNYIDKLQVATQHITGLISNMLDFAKLRSTAFQLKNEPFNLEMALQGVIALIQQQAAQKNLDFKIDIQDDVNVTVLGDRVRFAQVLINLLSNAIKYTQYGKILLRVNASLQAQQLYVNFDIEDTGIGIPQEYINKLFDPYVQYKPNSSKQGIGLGLYISQRLVTAMGGDIKVSSQLNKGSIFSFHLSLELFKPPTDSSSVDSSKAIYQFPEGAHVLLVDDSDTNRFIVSELLKGLGFYIEQAADGKQAVILLNEQSFDLIIVDINMPDMNGFELSQWIRQYNRNPNVPIIALTAHAVSEIETKVHTLGINAFITKPFNYKDLFDTVAQILNQSYNKSGRAV